MFLVLHEANTCRCGTHTDPGFSFRIPHAGFFLGDMEKEGDLSFSVALTHTRPSPHLSIMMVACVCVCDFSSSIYVLGKSLKWGNGGESISKLTEMGGSKAINNNINGRALAVHKIANVPVLSYSFLFNLSCQHQLAFLWLQHYKAYNNLPSTLAIGLHLSIPLADNGKHSMSRHMSSFANDDTYT